MPSIVQRRLARRARTQRWRRVGDGDLPIKAWITGIDHVQQQRGLGRFFFRRSFTGRGVPTGAERAMTRYARRCASVIPA